MIYDNDNMILLVDEEGNEAVSELLDLVEFEKNEYAVFLYGDSDEEVGEVLILKLEESDNDTEESFVSVDDEDTLMAVFNIFKDKFKDEFNFVD